jgi:hypothetical protein
MEADSIPQSRAARERKLVSLIAGVVILLDAAAARLALTADDASVYVFGHPIGWECSWRRIGLACPTCGMTRSVVLALHGQWARAWQMAPGGPLLAAGGLMLAVLLVSSAFRRAPWPRWVGAGGVVYAAATVLVWLGGWAVRFVHTWAGG